MSTHKKDRRIEDQTVTLRLALAGYLGTALGLLVVLGVVVRESLCAECGATWPWGAQDAPGAAEGPSQGRR